MTDRLRVIGVGAVERRTEVVLTARNPHIVTNPWRFAMINHQISLNPHWALVAFAQG